MPDLFHWWSNDLVLSATGDLLTVDALDRGDQRIVRRLCTNGPGATALDPSFQSEYLFHQDYGAGLPRYIGQPEDPSTIEALVRSQMYLEEAVLHAPEPVISSRHNSIGTLTTRIQYWTGDDAVERPLAFTLS